MRKPLIALAVTVAALVGAAPASAQIIELGNVGNLPTPSCPGASCAAMTRTTGVQTLAAGRRGDYTSPMAGRLVGVTLKLGNPNAAEIAYFNGHAGNGSTIQVSVLRPGRSANLFHQVGVSETFSLDKWFGQTVQFPLAQTLPLRRGDVIGLTVPTWAPVLAVQQGNSSAWRASRRTNQCAPANVFTQTALTVAPKFARFACVYQTARLTFGATIIATP